MSFQVRAGTSPHQQPASAGGSSYISPNLSYRGGGGNAHTHSSSTALPPFSLGDASSSAAGEVPVPASKRVGTDPTKYKTTICRNWEQTGNCSFRGCTFAHGVDDLRPPARTSGSSPPLPPQQSPSSTPPMYPQSAVMNNAGSLPGQSPYKIEQLLEMLVSEIQRERDMISNYAESNKALETMLRREQVAVIDAQTKVEALQNQAIELVRQVKERNSEILNLIGIAGSLLTPDQRHRAEALASWSFTQGDVHLYGKGKDDGPGAADHGPSSRRQIPAGFSDAPVSSSRGNNPAAPVWVPPPSSTPASSTSAAFSLDGTSNKDDASSVASPTSETNQLKELLEALRK